MTTNPVITAKLIVSSFVVSPARRHAARHWIPERTPYREKDSTDHSRSGRNRRRVPLVVGTHRARGAVVRGDGPGAGDLSGPARRRRFPSLEPIPLGFCRTGAYVGALTQLVECDLCKVEVRGSSPLCSTSFWQGVYPLPERYLVPRTRTREGATTVRRPSGPSIGGAGRTTVSPVISRSEITLSPLCSTPHHPSPKAFQKR